MDKRLNRKLSVTREDNNIYIHELNRSLCVSNFIRMMYDGLSRGYETCFDAKWNPNNPCIGQSPATALLVQEIFGGEIIRYKWKKRVHYFNRIDRKNFDLTSQERDAHPFGDNYDKCTETGISKKSRDILERKKGILMKNIGMDV